MRSKLFSFKSSCCMAIALSALVLVGGVFSPVYAALPDTGQTKCYNDTVEIPCPSQGQDFYGQDAQYTINPPSYTKLDANGNALPDSATSWGMVKDNVTGLIWENKTADGSIHDSGKTYTFNDAQNVFIPQLNAANFGGYSDWRLPTIKELSTLLDISRDKPPINTDYFPNTATTLYWSSSPTAFVSPIPNAAWDVDFLTGNTYYIGKSASPRVRAVRGNQLSSSLTDNGNGTVTDSSANLTWQKTSYGPATWKDSLSYCENLTFGGYSDWRLPNINELQSLADYNLFNPSVNTQIFSDTNTSSIYWSSSVYANQSNTAKGVNFYTGARSGEVKTNSNYVRCVRGQVDPPTRIIKLSGDLAFGNVNVGLTATKTLTISNTGNSPLTVSSIDYPVGFSGNWSGQIAANSSQPVPVIFSPAAAQLYSGTVKVNSDKTSGTNTIAISGTGLNTAPAAFNGSLTVTSGVSANGTLTATDANGDTLTYSIVTQPTKGTVTPNPAYPNFKYTPNAGFTGTDSFTFKANDGKADSNVATITIAACTPAVTANFTVPTNITANQTVTFINTSAPLSAKSWAWSIVNANNVNVGSGTAQNFAFTFTAAGTYTVSLTAADNNNCSSVKQASVTIMPPPGFRVWIDKNGNGVYDAGEEVSASTVRVNSETADRGTTDSQGIIQLQNISDNDKIYAQKIFYSMSNPKAGDSNFANNRNQNPYYAGSVNGKMYDFVMASDIRVSDGTYYDFPGQGKTLANATKDSQGNFLIQLVHPKIEWNLLVAFEEAQSADFYDKIRAGFKSYADYMYNFTDGYSVVKNVVLIKGAYKDTPQWGFCDVQVRNSEWPNAGIFGNRYNYWGSRISMGKTWYGDPDSYNWHSTLGHESGHYLLGFGDEYMNGNYTKGANVSWTYRTSHDGDAGEPNEFPRNYGVMQYQYSSHEMSDPTDYYPRTYSSSMDPDWVTHEFAISGGQSCWSFFKSFYQNDIKQQMAGQGFSDAFFNNLIIPPHTAGSYPTSDSTKRSGPSAMNRDVVSFIDWTMPGSTRRDIAEDVSDAVALVTDESGAAVANADVWLASSDRKSFQGRTDENGVVKCGSIFIGKRLEAYSDGRKAELVIDAVKNQYVLVLPLLKNRRDNTSGIVISATPDVSASKRLNLTISGNALSSAPGVNLSQSHGYSANIAMSSSGTNQYSGIADYQYNSGILQVTWGGSQSASPFEIFSTELAPASGFYAPNGELEMAYSKSSFASPGTLVMVNSSAPAPPNNGLIQIGNVYSFGFSGGTVKDVILRIRLSSGVNRSQLNLYGWDIQNKAWFLIQGGEADLKYFTISLASVSYVSYGLFSAPQANDPYPPNPVTGLTASTGTSRWSVRLQWTAPSDNSGVFAYDIRFNTVPITESNWNNSIQINDVPKPASSGTVQSMVVEMPDPNTLYYFGIKAIDAAGNMSTLTTLTSSVKSQCTDCVLSPGDVNGSGGEPDLADAILALQVLAGLSPPNVNVGADVNNDDKIGIEEVIYILQKVAGLR